MTRPARFPRAFLLLFLLGLSLAARAEESVSLAGKWRFSRDDAKKGAAARWYAKELKPSGDEPAEIALPGSTDQANAGHPNPAKPDLAGLYRPNVYAGPAWYQREIEIPSGWEGKRVTLFLERNHWTNRVWLDDKDCGTQDSLIAPQVFDLGTGLAPGKHRLTICVDNTLKYDLGGFASINYAYTQTNWNGIIGAIELRAADPVAISHLEVYPDLAGKKIKVVAQIANLTGAAAEGQLQLSVADADGKAQGTPATAAYSSSEAESTVTAEVPMGDDFKVWDQFSPNLYTLKAVLQSPGLHSEQEASFGMRELGRKGTQFMLNGHPIFLRGTLECAIFPLTGFPPTDVDSWRRIYRIEKSYGLNFIRFHSWCPPEAAFAAADREGVYVQAEGPDANIYFGGDAKVDAFLEKEFARTVETYGNHPSFLLMSLGNENAVSGGGEKLLTRWVDRMISTDPRHLYNSASCGTSTPNIEYTELIDGRGVRGPGTTGDLRDQVAKYAFPFVGHEIGQWAVYPDFDEMKKYTGVLAPKNFEIIRDDLARKGMLDEAPRFFQATGHLAALLYKEEIEVLLRTPGLGGFSLLDLHDYPGQGTALVGILDPFWDSKGFVTPQEHARYAESVVPLLRLPKRVYATGETLTAQAQLAQYGPGDLAEVHPSWTVKDAGGQEIASGSLPALQAPAGKLSDLGTLSVPLAKAHAPCKATVTVSLDGTSYANSWDIWIYPPAAPVSAPPDVTVATAWDDAKEALAAGRKVVFFPRRINGKASRQGWLEPIFWSPVWFHTDPATMGILCDPRHPIFAEFPTEFYGDWQWWNLVNRSRSIILDGTPKDFRPIVQVIDNFQRNDKMGNLFEASVGNGQLLVCTLPLLGSTEPEAVQLLRSLYRYAGSPAFRPKAPLGLDTLDALFVPAPSRLQALGVTVFKADSEAAEYPASNAIDGDPATFWHTRWQPAPDPLPHSLILDLGKDMTVMGLAYLPRQDSSAGRIKQYRFYVAESPEAMGPPVAEGEFPDGNALQTVMFATPARGRYVKLEALSEVNGQAVTSVADIDLMLQP
jgi:hypothetical protein